MQSRQYIFFLKIRLYRGASVYYYIACFGFLKRERERERDVEIVQLNISGEGRDHDQIGVVLKYEHSQYNEGDRVKVRN